MAPLIGLISECRTECTLCDGKCSERKVHSVLSVLLTTELTRLASRLETREMAHTLAEHNCHFQRVCLATDSNVIGNNNSISSSRTVNFEQQAVAMTDGRGCARDG